MKKRLYIFVENFEREFFGKFDLAIECVSRVDDLEIVIGDQRDLFYLSRLGVIRNSICLLKSCQPYVVDFVRRLKSLDNQILLQDEEGLLVLDIPGQARENRNSLQALDLTSKIFCWNDCELSNFMAMSPSLKDKLIMAGNLRTSQSVDYPALYSEEIDKIKRTYGQYVLIVGNGKIAFSHYQGKHLREVIEQSMTLNNRSSEYREFVRSWSENTCRSYISIFHAMMLLKNKYGEQIGIVYRPHPGEDSRLVEALLENIDVKVTSEYGIYPWILGATCVIGSGSTSLIESSCLNRPVFSMVEGEDSHCTSLIKEMSCHRLSEICTSSEELLTKVQKYIDDNSFNCDIFLAATEYAKTEKNTKEEYISAISKIATSCRGYHLPNLLIAMVLNFVEFIWVFRYSRKQKVIHNRKFSTASIKRKIVFFRDYAGKKKISVASLGKRVVFLKNEKK